VRRNKKEVPFPLSGGGLGRGIVPHAQNLLMDKSLFSPTLSLKRRGRRK